MNKLIIFLLLAVLFLTGCEVYNTLYVKAPEVKPIPIFDTDEFYQQSKILEGFETECFENNTVEKYELIEPNTDRDCVEICGIDTICRSVKFKIKCEMNLENKLGCFEDCTSNSTKPFIRFWNETICTKEILVRRLE